MMELVQASATDEVWSRDTREENGGHERLEQGLKKLEAELYQEENPPKRRDISAGLAELDRDLQRFKSA
jgi:hypothetical protein